jgi:hypothetical protein
MVLFEMWQGLAMGMMSEEELKEKFEYLRAK